MLIGHLFDVVHCSGSLCQMKNNYHTHKHTHTHTHTHTISLSLLFSSLPSIFFSFFSVFLSFFFSLPFSLSYCSLPFVHISLSFSFLFLSPFIYFLVKLKITINFPLFFLLWYTKREIFGGMFKSINPAWSQNLCLNVFGMAAMLFLLFCSDCFHENSLA